MTRTEPLDAARSVLEDLNLTEAPQERIPPTSGHRSSVLVPCNGPDGRPYLLKYFSPPEDAIYPPGERSADYARREAAFYRFLDSTDPDRTLLWTPRTVLTDPCDPPRWILLERIPGAIGPAEELLSLEPLLELLRRLQDIPIDRLLGRRDFPLNHWEPVSYLDRIRQMYDPVLFVIGERRWRGVQKFFEEALRWTDNRPSVLVHGEFTEDNILVGEDGRPYLLDFERVGIGNQDHDLAWFWIHSRRDQSWKRSLLQRWFGHRVGSDRIRSEWGIRAALVYLALRRLRFGYLASGEEDPRRTANLALLDAALAGGAELFPP